MDKKNQIEKNKSGTQEEAGYPSSLRANRFTILEGIPNPYQRSQKLSRSPSREMKQKLVLSNKNQNRSIIKTASEACFYFGYRKKY